MPAAYGVVYFLCFLASSHCPRQPRKLQASTKLAKSYELQANYGFCFLSAGEFTFSQLLSLSLTFSRLLESQPSERLPFSLLRCSCCLGFTLSFPSFLHPSTLPPFHPPSFLSSTHEKLSIPSCHNTHKATSISGFVSYLNLFVALLRCLSSSPIPQPLSLSFCYRSFLRFFYLLSLNHLNQSPMINHQSSESFNNPEFLQCCVSLLCSCPLLFYTSPTSYHLSFNPKI